MSHSIAVRDEVGCIDTAPCSLYNEPTPFACPTQLGEAAPDGPARPAQTYLDLRGRQPACSEAASCLFAALTRGDLYGPLVAALVLAALATLSLVVASAFLLYSRRVVTNSLRFLVRIAGHALLLYWLAACALGAVNVVLLQLRATAARTFLSVGPVALASFIVALAVGQALLVRRILGFYVPERRPVLRRTTQGWPVLWRRRLVTPR